MMITRLFLPVLFLLCAGCAPMKPVEPVPTLADLERRAAELDRPTYEKAHKAAIKRIQETDKAFGAEVRGEMRRRGMSPTEFPTPPLPVSERLLMAHDEAVKVAGPPSPYVTELKLYEVILHEQLEAGLLTEAGLRSLFEQKRSEVIGRIMDEGAAKKRLLIE